MVERVPTPEQMNIISSPLPRFVVTASAGAGKTFVLVERYLRHVVEEGLRPDEILTITFTKKAAAEMKSRIVKSLRDKALFEEAQIAETGPIQTIHSFCERLLRENAFEAGLDPQFEILSDSQSARLATECARQAICGDLEDSPQAEALLASLAGKRPYSKTETSPYRIIESSVLDVLVELRASGWDLEQVREGHSGPEALAEFWNDELTRALDPSIRTQLQFVEGNSLQECIQKAAKEAGMKVPGWARGQYDSVGEEQALHQTCGLVQLACDAWWRLEREMASLQALDFTGLESRAVQLLDSSEVTRERVRKQYKIAMVDEAQDMNPIQHRLLDLLEIDRQMLVGDDKQSIYGFRQADLDLFRNKARAGETLRLSKNHRSDAGVLSFIDLLFGKLWSGSYQRMNHSQDPFDLDKVVSIDCSGVEFWQHDARDTHGTAQYVKELVEEGISPERITVLVRDAAFASSLHEQLVKAGIDARIVGGSERFYTRMEVRDLANALRAVADPQDDFSLLACLRSPLAGLSLDSIVLLAAEGDVATRIQSFVPPLDSDAEKLARFLTWYMPLQKIADRLSAWEVLSEIYAKSAYLEALALRPEPDQLLANVRKLLTLAVQEPELGPLEYAERIREIQDLRHKEGDAPAGAEDEKSVTLMTIHKAKGLEFDVVVVPQTDRLLASKGRDLIIEPRLGLVACRFDQVHTMMYRYLLHLKRRREEDEEMRVLYVALTRAKTKLCICTYERAKPGSIAKAVLDAVGDSPPPGVSVRDSQTLAAVPA